MSSFKHLQEKIADRNAGLAAAAAAVAVSASRSKNRRREEDRRERHHRSDDSTTLARRMRDKEKEFRRRMEDERESEEDRLRRMRRETWDECGRPRMFRPDMGRCARRECSPPRQQRRVVHICGPQGVCGIAGRPGRPGRDGCDGLPGRNGCDGRKGDKGDKGDAGRPGRDGCDGEPGRNGRDGKNGKDGCDGKKGDKGDKGDKGEPGRDGRDGVDGRNGRDGIKGDRGFQGTAGAVYTVPCPKCSGNSNSSGALPEDTSVAVPEMAPTYQPMAPLPPPPPMASFADVAAAAAPTLGFAAAPPVAFGAAPVGVAAPVAPVSFAAPPVVSTIDNVVNQVVNLSDEEESEDECQPCCPDTFGYLFFAPQTNTLLAPGEAVPFTPGSTRNIVVTGRTDGVSGTDIVVYTCNDEPGVFEICFNVVPRDASQFAVQINDQTNPSASQVFGSSVAGQENVPVTGCVIVSMDTGSTVRIVLLNTTGTRGSGGDSTQLDTRVGGRALATVAWLKIHQIAWV